MTNLTKQEQAEALAEARFPTLWSRKNVTETVTYWKNKAMELVGPDLEDLHANGFEIRRKEDE